MRTIWKYRLPIVDEQTLSVPSSYRLLHVDNQKGLLCLWLEVDPSYEKIGIKIAIAGTGGPVPKSAIYIGTAVCDPFVWHVYQKVEKTEKA